MKRVFLETYGCQMNVADSELMAGVLLRAGMSLTDRPEDADAVLLNTCAIREHAEQRVLGRLGEFARLKAGNPRLVVGVAGCMAQHLRRRLLDETRVLDLVVGPDGYRDLPALLRLRYTSPHPSDFSARMIAALAACPQVCPQVHLPVQSGSDTVLAAMNRTYTVAEYRAVVERLRAAIPGIALSTDVIVGFTGE